MSRRRDHVMEDFYKAADVGRNDGLNRTVQIESMLTRTLTELCMARYEWLNTPISVSERYLEIALFQRGCAVYFDHKDYGNLALVGTPSSRLNHYGDPLGFLATGQGGFGAIMLKKAECEPIYANALRRTDVDIVKIYASRLAEVDRTLEINTFNARQTGFAAVPENLLLSMQNMQLQISEGVRMVTIKAPEFGQPSLQDMISTVDLSINPDLFDRMHVLRTRWYNECLGLLGIDNTNQDKKERLVEAEVDGNADQIAATRRVNLNQRQDACERINRRFGTNISVDYYKRPVEAEPVEPEPTGGAV